MKLTHTIGAAIVFATSSVTLAGQPVNLQPSQFAGGLSGITNTQLPELIGSEFSDYTYNFTISGDEGDLYSAVLMTRVVRSNETGLLHFNYRIMNPNDDLTGAISHIDISGYADLETRVEYRNEASGPGDQGPVDAMRDASGDVVTFDFGDSFDTSMESKYFFVMTNTDTFNVPTEGVVAGSSTATIYLRSGESVSFSIVGAGPVPSPGALALLSLGGLVTTRRRR